MADEAPNSMCSWWRSRMLRWLFEEPHRHSTEKRQQRRPAKNIDIRHQRDCCCIRRRPTPLTPVAPAHGPLMIKYVEIIADFCCKTALDAVRFAPISVWCSAARRMIAVVAIAIPIDRHVAQHIEEASRVAHFLAR